MFVAYNKLALLLNIDVIFFQHVNTVTDVNMLMFLMRSYTGYCDLVVQDKKESV